MNPRAVVLALFALTLFRSPRATAEAFSSLPDDAIRRVVAVGDLHADLANALAVLKLAGVTDAEGNWIAAPGTVLVQTGDLVDRGPDSKEVIELMMRLEREASAAGSAVHCLLGNHEAMNLEGHLGFVSLEDLADFDGDEEKRALAFSEEGELGKWLRKKDIAVKVLDTVFVHGGLSPQWAGEELDFLNQQGRLAFTGSGGKVSRLLLGEKGPLWNRHYLLAREELACPQLESALEKLGASRMVVGHTVQQSGRVASRCGGQIFGIDTGISAYYGSNQAALEITPAGDIRAIYPDQEDVLTADNSFPDDPVALAAAAS